MVLCCLSLSLTACGPFGSHSRKEAELQVQLPAVPPNIIACFRDVTQLPPGEWDLPTITAVMADLRKSELNKTKCGRELLKFYDAVRGKKPKR